MAIDDGKTNTIGVVNLLASFEEARRSIQNTLSLGHTNTIQKKIH